MKDEIILYNRLLKNFEWSKCKFFMAKYNLLKLKKY